MLHSLAHMLMTSIALECGYPASSLRERVYAGEGRYGILIYTGASDSEGTLGGLVDTWPPLRGPSAPCPSRQLLLLCLQRSGLRRARPGLTLREPPAARRRLPRLPADRRDELRAAQRLPRPGARRAPRSAPRMSRSSTRSTSTREDARDCSMLVDPRRLKGRRFSWNGSRFQPCRVRGARTPAGGGTPLVSEGSMTAHERAAHERRTAWRLVLPAMLWTLAFFVVPFACIGWR